MKISDLMDIKLQPRRWQVTAGEAWRRNGHRGVVQVVTAAGKTIFAGQCMKAASEVFDAMTVVVVVPSIPLQDQWYVSLTEDFGVPDDAIALWSGKSKPTENRPFNVMVVNTARRAAPLLSSEVPVMLIVDECHRVGSHANSLALSGDHIATLGLSATPERDYDEAFEEIILPALGPIVFSYSLADAAADGVIAPYDMVNIRVPLLPDEERQYDALTKRIARAAARKEDVPEDSDHLKVMLMKRARISARASFRVPVAVRFIEKFRGVKCLAFHEEIDQAEALYDLLIKRGHSATIYHSGMGASRRRDNLRLFRRGVFDVLVSCRALDEGINIPEARLAVIAAASATERQRVQRLGRVLRPAPGKDAALVCTLYATKVEEDRLHREVAESGARSVQWQESSVVRG